MPTYHIHINGQVQGVGFRPFVYKLARSFGLVGWVNNTVDGVHIRLNARQELASSFYQKVIEKAPALAVITAHSMQEVTGEAFVEFEIIHSNKSGIPNLLLTPDFAMCSDCERELLSAQDRRHRYAFITCTNCGPRYSIVTGLPYDREFTTMSVFPMCPTCAEEYDNPLDRRYFSQTNSCEQCGVQLYLFDGGVRALSSDNQEAISQTVQALVNGKIVAVKGIGGYLILADATNPAAISLLRKRKHRPGKPFAVMYPDLQWLQKDVTIRSTEIEKLRSPVAPILLLPAKETPGSGIDLEGVAPGLRQIGAMLPYAPLYKLLLEQFNRPLVATSGNVSGTPIVFEDAKARTDLPVLVDYILGNNRAIAVPQDDSVIRVTEKEQQPIIIRRSRGIAPTHLEAGIDWPVESILSMGAFLKSSFTLLHQQNTYISQYLGKLDYLETQENFRHTLRHFLRLFDAKIERVIVDKHPAYFSTQLGKALATEWQVPIIEVQHHKAHFGAVLAEHQLLSAQEPVLGVIWDGTGLGDDGQIWGGEFFIYQEKAMRRIAHLSYYPWILQDKMALEPRIAALVACQGIAGAAPILIGKFTTQEWRIYQRFLAKPQLHTSSMGRLFDAVSALLGLVDKSTYEGQAAMLLEQLAKKCPSRFDFDWNEGYLYDASPEEHMPLQLLLTRVIEAIAAGEPPEEVAAKFHFSLIHYIKRIANKNDIKHITFSGGVWQNALLVDMAIHYLENEAKLYFHRQLSPNDECISYGGLICYLTQ